MKGTQKEVLGQEKGRKGISLHMFSGLKKYLEMPKKFGGL